MSENLAAAAAALGIPEALVQRSAAAKAAETGMTVDEVLAIWAGGGEIAQTPASASPPPPPPSEVASEAPSPAIEPPPMAGAAEDAASRGTVGRAPVPREVTLAEAAHLPEVVTVPTAGIRERTNFRIPKWLAALILIIPAFALFTMGGSATGNCGDATELTADVITGQVVNCDGSEFTGSGAAGGTVDYIALGESIYLGTGAAGVNCSGCHGAGGAGSAAFPALNGVLTTFGACSDHEHWVRVGSAGLQGEGASTYGDTGKSIKGGMPGHSTLTDEQLASVVAFERVRFGGADKDAALADCGLIDVGGGEGDGTTGTTEVAPGDGTTETTGAPAA